MLSHVIISTLFLLPLALAEAECKGNDCPMKVNFLLQSSTKTLGAQQPEEATSVCKDDPTTWETYWGDCSTYVPNGKNHNWCAYDSSNGFTAVQVCPGCGQCVLQTEDNDSRTEPGSGYGYVDWKYGYGSGMPGSGNGYGSGMPGSGLLQSSTNKRGAQQPEEGSVGQCVTITSPKYDGVCPNQGNQTSCEAFGEHCSWDTQASGGSDGSGGGAEQATPACKDDPNTWETYWGDCSTYVPNGMNHNWCAYDSSNGFTAVQVCPGCGQCVLQTDSRTEPGSGSGYIDWKYGYGSGMPGSGNGYGSGMPGSGLLQSSTNKLGAQQPEEGSIGQCVTITSPKYDGVCPNQGNQTSCEAFGEHCSWDTQASGGSGSGGGAEQATPACEDDPNTWETYWGDCSTYVPNGKNHNWCAYDSANGFTAVQVCPGCGQCVLQTEDYYDDSRTEPGSGNGYVDWKYGYGSGMSGSGYGYGSGM